MNQGFSLKTLADYFLKNHALFFLQNRAEFIIIVLSAGGELATREACEKILDKATHERMFQFQKLSGDAEQDADAINILEQRVSIIVKNRVLLIFLRNIVPPLNTNTRINLFFVNSAQMPEDFNSHADYDNLRDEWVLSIETFLKILC